MPVVHVAPDGNRTLWADGAPKPDGYFTEAEWNALHPPPLPEEAEPVAVDRRAEILAELGRMDVNAIRPMRAVAAGVADAGERAILVCLEERAEDLRAELAGLAPG